MPRKQKEAPAQKPDVHDRDLEESAIAYAMQRHDDGDDEAITALCSQPDEIFYTETNRAVLRAMRAIRLSGDRVDGIAISIRLRASGELESVGGLYAIARIAQAFTAGVASIAPALDGLRALLRVRVGAEQAARLLHAVSSGADPSVAAQIMGDAVATADIATALPWGYYLDDDGCLMREAKGEDAKPTRIAPCAIYIVARALDVLTGTHTVTLRWRLYGKTHTHDCERQHIAISRDLAKLAGIGLPVTSETARGIVAYLAALEECCGVPMTRSARQCGWHDAELRTYLRGTHRHTGPGVAAAECPEWMRGHGTDAMIDAITTAGDAAASSALLLDVVQRFDVPRLTIAAACVPPLLRVLGAPSFALDLAAPTSQGKTSAMLVALSVWGNPDRLLMGWDTTRVGVETSASALCALPVPLDDTQRAAKRDDCARMVYDLTSGIGKLRGAPGGGLRPTLRYETVLLSTGEGPLVSQAAAGGARARTLSIQSPPWGGVSMETGEFVRATVAAARLHHGHAGERLINLLVAMPDAERAELRADFHQLTSQFVGRLNALIQSESGPVPALDRVAQYLASIEIAGRMLTQAMDWPDVGAWVSPAILDGIARVMPEADRARAALEHAYTWLHSNPARVAGLEDRDLDGGVRMPSNGYIGMSDGKRIAFTPAALDTELTRAGFDPLACVGAWERRGWLALGNERGHERDPKVTLRPSLRIRAYVLSAEALKLLGHSTGFDDSKNNADEEVLFKG